MAKFVFQLRAVLRQREGVERQKQLALARVEQERLALESELRACQAELSSERDTLRRELAPGGPRTTVGESGGMRIDLRGVRLQSNAALRIIGRAQQAAVKLAGVHQRLEGRRAELLRAATDRKAIEKLRERRFEAWVMEQRQREAAVLDEIAVMRASRRVHEDPPEQEGGGGGRGGGQGDGRSDGGSLEFQA